ncbi:MAG: hypothetical protein K8R35_06635 [Bacteroidales bacterium]|nr:hypothetical protein [Bacteroidales bacterium]
MKRIITLIIILFFCNQFSLTYAEEARWVVTGVVRDNSGNPLPGAAILVKDTFMKAILLLNR